MKTIDIHNLDKVLGDIGVKFCTGTKGNKCYGRRRKGGRLCLQCHRDYMRELRESGDGRRAEVVNGYDFNQESRYS